MTRHDRSFRQRTNAPSTRTEESKEQENGERYFIWSGGKGQSKVYSTAYHEDPTKEQRCSSTLSLTSALDGVDEQRHTPGLFVLGKETL